MNDVRIIETTDSNDNIIFTVERLKWFLWITWWSTIKTPEIDRFNEVVFIPITFKSFEKANKWVCNDFKYVAKSIVKVHEIECQ